MAALLGRPGTEPTPLSPEAVSSPETFLDLPVDLPMLAPEIPVMHARPAVPALKIERKKTLFGIYENEDSVSAEDQVQIRRDSRLAEVSVAAAVAALYRHAVTLSSGEKVHSIDSFQASVRDMFPPAQSPSESVVLHLFRTFDASHAGLVTLLSVETAIVLLAHGTETEKIGAIFHIADLDRDGSLSLDELVVFFRLIFSNVMTRSVLGIMNANGVPFASSEQLALTTAMECMQMCDLDGNGLLSLAEFKKWFHTPKLQPALPVSPFIDPTHTSVCLHNK